MLSFEKFTDKRHTSDVRAELGVNYGGDGQSKKTASAPPSVPPRQKLASRTQTRSESTGSDELESFLTEKVLNNDSILDSLKKLSVRAAEVTNGQIAAAGESDFSATLFDGSLDGALAQVELQGTLAKHGLTPLNSVEGLIKLRGALVQAYRDNAIVPVETRLKAEKCRLEIDKIVATRDTAVKIEEARVLAALENAKLQAELMETKAKTDRITKELEQKRRELTEATLTERAFAQSAMDSVEAERLARKAENRGQLLDLETGTDKVERYLRARRKRVRAVFDEGVKPILKRVIPTLIILILAANLVADGPGREDTLILGPVNDAWDGIYMPLRDGVVRVWEQFDSK